MIPYFQLKPECGNAGTKRCVHIADSIVGEDNSITVLDYVGKEHIMAFNLIKAIVETECNTIKSEPVLVVFHDAVTRCKCMELALKEIPCEFHSDDYLLTENSAYAINFRMEDDVDSLNEKVLFDYIIVCGAAQIAGNRLYRLVQTYKDTARLILVGREQGNKHLNPEYFLNQDEKRVWQMFLNHPEVRVIRSVPDDVQYISNPCFNANNNAASAQELKKSLHYHNQRMGGDNLFKGLYDSLRMFESMHRL